jgi:branched-chain amino acid transport system substrate-binding protein
MGRLAAAVLSFLALMAQPATAAKPESVGNTIVMGESGVFSGPLGAYAADNHALIHAYFDSINAKGGIHGRKLKMIELDDAFDPKRTVENAKTLIEKENAFALMNVIGTANTGAIYPILEEYQIPLVGPYSGAAALRDPKFRYLFFTRATYGDETEKMVEQLTSTGVKDIAIAYQDDPFGKAGLQAASEALARHNLKPVSVGAFNIAKLDVETGPAAEAALKGRPAAIIVVSSGKGTTSFIKEVMNRGQQVTFYCLSVTNPNQLWAELGPNARGIVVTQTVPSPWRASTPLIREYQKIAALAKLKSSQYSYGMLEAFVVTKVVAEALRLAGKNLTREKYFAALESMQNYDVGGYSIRYGPGKHAGSSYVDLSIIGKDGQFLH